MKPWQFGIGFLWCAVSLATLSRAHKERHMRIWPQKPVVEFGGFVVINCTTNCQHFTGFGIETSLSKETIENGTFWKAFRLKNVTEWTPRPLCYLNCDNGEQLQSQGADITVYRAPNRVVLDSLPEVEVGKKYNLTCYVFDVAPIRNVTVTFLRGGEKLYQETFEEHSNAAAGDLVVTHTFTAQRVGHGSEFSCQAALDLRPEAELFEKASHNQSLRIVGAHKERHVRIRPQKPVVEFGGFVVINCTTNCQHFTGFGIETSLSKETIENGTFWKAFRLKNVTEWTPRPLCYLNCDNGEQLQSQGADITVYRAPNRVVLDPLPKVKVGKKYNLTCCVSGVAPIRNVTVTFLRGGEKLYQETFEEHSNAAAGDLVVTHSLMAQRADHGMEFRCQAALDLRPEAELFEKASHNQSLRIVAPPEYVTVELKRSPGHSWVYNLTCHIINAIPDSNFTVSFFKGAKSLHAQKFWKTTLTNFTVHYTITLQPQDHGQEITCHVTLNLEESFMVTSSKLELKTAETCTAITVAACSIAILVALLVGIFAYWLCVAKTKKGRTLS
ncbi:intercellular adhesion molecule 3-like [Tiliqua scincoides]|uniref:intercellular adhesion molecule 3-like n=1 Tax=Tiliqua scincoides TaxID=71010 RepID=UPI003461F1EB